MTDTYPIRLPSGGKAHLILPDVFTQADADHIKRWLDLIAQQGEGGAAKESSDGL